MPSRLQRRRYPALAKALLGALAKALSRCACKGAARSLLVIDRPLLLLGHAPRASSSYPTLATQVNFIAARASLSLSLLRAGLRDVAHLSSNRLIPEASWSRGRQCACVKCATSALPRGTLDLSGGVSYSVSAYTTLT